MKLTATLTAGLFAAALAQANTVVLVDLETTTRVVSAVDRLKGGAAWSFTVGNAAGAAAFNIIGITAAPEPTTVLLMSQGLACLAWRRRHG